MSYPVLFRQCGYQPYHTLFALYTLSLLANKDILFALFRLWYQLPNRFLFTVLVACLHTLSLLPNKEFWLLNFRNRSDGDYGAAKVMLRPASPGTGVIAGGAVRIVLEMAGVENALGKQLGSNNALNNARATVVAVQQMRQFSEVARERGIPMEELWKWSKRTCMNKKKFVLSFCRCYCSCSFSFLRLDRNGRYWKTASRVVFFFGVSIAYIVAKLHRNSLWIKIGDYLIGKYLLQEVKLIYLTFLITVDI